MHDFPLCCMQVEAGRAATPETGVDLPTMTGLQVLIVLETVTAQATLTTCQAYPHCLGLQQQQQQEGGQQVVTYLMTQWITSALSQLTDRTVSNASGVMQERVVFGYQPH
jgi:hypothetical protein